jgi:hypothetical protein
MNKPALASRPMSATRRSRLVVKLLIAFGVLAAFGYLFLRSLESTRSEPYIVDAAHAMGWTLTLEPSRGANSPLLTLVTGKALVTELFNPLFRRSMESMTTPQHAAIPVVLHGEFDRALQGRLTPDALLAAAREAGLESARIDLRCMAHRRVSQPGETRQVYFVIVDAPAVGAFRDRLASTAADAFDAPALTPVMMVGASDARFDRWLPIRADDTECVAPVQIER